MTRKTAFFILITASIYSVSAQSNREVVTQGIEWLSLNSTIKLHSKFGLAFDTQLRFAGALQNMQHMPRLGFEYYVNKKLSVIPVGYAFIKNYLYGKQPANFVNDEHRIFQQVAYKHNLVGLPLSHRLRFEERFIQSHHKENDIVINDGFTNKQFRIRYRLMTNIPLTNKSLEPKTLYVSVWDEIFMSWGKSVTFNEPDQNRVFIGPGYQISRHVAVQGGPFYQLLIKSNGTKQENNVGVLLQLNYNFDLMK